MQKKANVCPLKCNTGLFVIVVGLSEKRAPKYND